MNPPNNTQPLTHPISAVRQALTTLWATLYNSQAHTFPYNVLFAALYYGQFHDALFIEVNVRMTKKIWNISLGIIKLQKFLYMLFFCCNQKPL